MTRVAVVGAGVSGLTCGVVLQESGCDVTLFFSPDHKPASPVAAAIWYPYHIRGEAEEWALQSYRRFEELARDPRTGVSMVEFQVLGIDPPQWALSIPHRALADAERRHPAGRYAGILPARTREEPGRLEASVAAAWKAALRGFAVQVPLIETPKYLPWLRDQLPAGFIPARSTTSRSSSASSTSS